MKKFFKIVSIILAFCLGREAQAQESFHEHKGIFFRISGNGIKSPSYILGTFHTIPGDFVYTLPRFEEIIGSVELLVTEYDFDWQFKNLPHRNATKEETDSLIGHIMTLYTKKDGSVRSFVSDLSRKQRDQVKGSLYYWGFTDPADWSFENVYRNYANRYLKKQLEEINTKGYDFRIWESPVDLYLMDSIATKYKLQLIGLDKKNAVNRYSEEKQRLEILWGYKTKRKVYSQYLGNRILDIRKGCQTGTFYLSQAYLESDISWIQNTSKSPGEIEERNAWWMEQIPGIIQSQSSFIAVGIAHLMNGRDYEGILSKLERLGYIIERIK